MNGLKSKCSLISKPGHLNHRALNHLMLIFNNNNPSPGSLIDYLVSVFYHNCIALEKFKDSD